jgi:RNA polymerase sigma-70 factor (ECF subfamily)
MRDLALPPSDVDLVEHVRRGDATAETALYDRYAARVYFLALSELHSKEDAEDVRAETFLRVIQALRANKLRSSGALSSFIVGIALNVIREQTRRKYKTQPFDDSELELTDRSSPETVFLDDETGRAIREVASQMRPREREFLRLYYYEELPAEEIAHRLGIKTERLRLIKSRALKRFREAYRKSRPE